MRKSQSQGRCNGTSNLTGTAMAMAIVLSSNSNGEQPIVSREF